MVAPASNEAERQIASIKFPSTWKCEVFAAEPMVSNPVAMALDAKGNIFVCESFRQNQGVTDNRSHDKKWVLADLASMTVEDRIAYHRELLGAEAVNYERQVDRIRVLIDEDRDGKADASKIFVSGFNSIEEGTAAGVLVRGSNVYLTCIPKLWRFEDKDHDFVVDAQHIMYDGFGVRVAFRGHDMHGLLVGPDGRLYFTIGDRGYHVVTDHGILADPESGAVFRCELDGTHLEVVATGLRNPQEIAFDDYGNFFTCDNNSDSGDEARWTVVAPGGDSGWRMMYQYLPDRGPFNRESIWHPFSEDSPAYIVPPIANFSDGPSGLVAYPGTGLSDVYRGAFFLCDFRGQSSNSGVRVAKPVPKGAFFELTNEEQPIWNILATDIDFGMDGSIYVADWVNGWNGEGKGRIYRFFDPQVAHTPLVQETATLLGQEMDQRSETELQTLLSHPDRRVRLESQFALVNRNAVGLLARIASDRTLPELARIHACWGLGQLVRQSQAEAADALRKIASDSISQKTEPAEVVVAALHALSDSLYQAESASGTPAEKIKSDMERTLSELIVSESPRIRYAAALATGRFGLANLQPQVVELLASNQDRDPMLRHAGIMAFVGMPVESIVSLRNHGSESVRVAAVVALRKKQAVEIADFVQDSSERVRLEVARAIHDVPQLHARLAALAAEISRPSESEPWLHRVLNANFRVGSVDNARALAQFAEDPKRPAEMRREALSMLESWENPGLQDRVMNRYAPLARRDPKEAANALDSVLASLLKAEPSVRAKARDVAAELGLQAIAPALLARVQDKNAPGDERAKSLDSLLRLKSPSLYELVKVHKDDLSPAVRTASLRILALFDVDAACEEAKRRVYSDVMTERQSAWDLMGKINSPKATTLIEEGVIRYLESRLAKDCWLNVKEAAQGRIRPELAARLAEREAENTAKAAENAILAYQDCLVGGDQANGRTLFFESAQLSCLRCHEVGKDGGEVGPKLTDIGIKRNAEYLLEAIVAPSAKLAEGFETILIQTDEGEIITGILKQRTDEALTITKPDGSLISIPTDSIEATKKGQSSMPADLMKYLSRRELRDLVAYLTSLDGKVEKNQDAKKPKGHGR